MKQKMILVDYAYQTATTYHLKDEQYGLLQRMYAVYFERGTLPSDMQVIIKWLHRDGRIAKKVQDLLDEFFTLSDDCYTCEWIDREVEYHSERLLKNFSRTSQGLLEDFSRTSIGKKPIKSMAEEPKQTNNQTNKQASKQATEEIKQEKKDIPAYQTKLQDIVEDIYKDVSSGVSISDKQQELYNTYNRPVKAAAAAEVGCWVDERFKCTSDAALQTLWYETKKDNRRVSEFNDVDTEMYNRRMKGKQ